METINIRDINLKAFEMLPTRGAFSTIYRNHNTCYKIFHKLSSLETKELYKKFCSIENSNIKIDNVVLPQKFIMDKRGIKGYTSPYISNSVSLFTKFLVETEYLDIHVFLESMNKSNKILKQIHENDIICKDLNFDNILIDSNNECYYIDLDGCSYGGIETDLYPLLTYNFFRRYRKTKD